MAVMARMRFLINVGTGYPSVWLMDSPSGGLAARQNIPLPRETTLHRFMLENMKADLLIFDGAFSESYYTPLFKCKYNGEVEYSMHLVMTFAEARELNEKAIAVAFDRIAKVRHATGG